MIKYLVKNRLRSAIGAIIGRGRGGSVKKASPLKIVAFVLLYAYVIGLFLFLSGMAALAFGAALIPSGAPWMYFGIFMIASFSFVFLFSIFETKSELFECKDNELLLSMPIKPRDIVASRISVVLIYNYIEELIIMLPCILFYAIFSKGDIVGIIGGLFVILLIPLLATAISSAVGYIVALISKKIKKNSFVTLAIAVVFMFVYMYGYSAIAEKANEFLATSHMITPADSPLLYFIGSAAVFKPISIIALTVLSIGIALLAYVVISKSYIKIVTDRKGEKRRVYKEEKLKSKGTLSALTYKELKRFFSSATYMINTGFGLIFGIILAVFALIKRDSLAEIIKMLSGEFALSSPEDIICPIMIVALVFISGFTTISSCALSLEGENLWIIKTLPVRVRDVMLSKALPHIMVSLPATVISSILLIIASGAPIRYWPLFILTPISANVFSAFLGLVINVAFPKFEYDNEAQPIKQSVAVFLVMIIQLLIGLAVLGLTFVLSIFGFGFLSALFVLLLFCGLSAAFCAILLGPSARKYEKIDV
jgi:ABC-2 type transport system permease protein